MTIDISPVTTSKVSSLDFSCSYEDGSSSVFEDCIFGARIVSCVAVAGRLSDNGGCITLKMSVRFDYEGECARCLDRVGGSFSSEIERTLREASESADDGAEEYVPVNDGMLELDDIICEELLLAFPSKLLCSEDCPGICPRCGKKKNGECVCTGKEIDPRLKILEQLLEK